jgi:thiamine-monophosphate kinase
MRLSELGEHGLLAELAARGLAERIGDDTAELAGGVVVTQDVLVENVHFQRRWISWHDLGYKAAAVNLSDLAAAAAEPEALFLTLGLEPDRDVEDVIELFEGVAETGVAVRGGDLTTADRVLISVAAVGRSDRVPGRGGAKPGDLLVVTGPLGGSAAGLAALERGLAGPPELVHAHRRPPFRLDAGRRLGPLAHAMIDLSDGIASDAARIAERSRCRLEIDVERLPLFPGLDVVGPEPFWTMGEDYELLAALSPDDATASGFAVVGRCTDGAGAVLLRDGEPLPLTGWDHFGARTLPAGS